jgi:dTDP-4-dehydrorhamnose 3,5-epimerase
MKFIETKIKSVFIIEPFRFEDERGFFASAFRSSDFAARGLASVFVGTNISYNKTRGTLRGIHYQAAPYGQDKLIRCVRGAIYDVAVDLRPNSPTFKQWVGVKLTAENRSMVYVPGDCGHGYQTLVDDTEVCYMVSRPYVPESGRGVRWNDPSFQIKWPDAGTQVLIARDQEYPDFTL